MKAACLTGPEGFEVREIPKPEINENEVLVKVQACAICGTDLRIYRFGHTKVKYPAIIGHEVAGTVAEVGKAVQREIEPIVEGSRVMVTPGIPCLRCGYCSLFSAQNAGGFLKTCRAVR